MWEVGTEWYGDILSKDIFIPRFKKINVNTRTHPRTDLAKKKCQ